MPHRPPHADEPVSYPSGQQPYDTLNGLRIGAVAGAVAGAISSLMIGAGASWLIVVGAAGGGAVGYFWERRRQVGG